VGRIALKPATEGELSGRAVGFHLVRAFWFDASCFVWARIGAREDGQRFSLEAQMQANLLVPGVTHVLGSAVADDGRPYILLAPGGRPLDASWLQKSSLTDLLLLALEATRILRVLAQAGLELPDVRMGRFLLERGGALGLRIADLDRIERRDPAAAAITHGKLAVEFTSRMLTDQDGGLRPDVPAQIKSRLRGAAPLPVLGKLLAEHAARSSDGAT
jgi:hypothetical protein